MKADTWNRLDAEFVEFPIMCARDVPGEEEVRLAEQAISIPFPDDYREFLLRYGGAMVGPYPVYGLRQVDVMGKNRWSVVDVTNEIRMAGLDDVSEWIVISEDHSGNPVGVDAEGRIWLYDHDFGGATELASDFETYLRTFCLKVES